MARPDLNIRTIYFAGIEHLRLHRVPLADMIWIILSGLFLTGLIAMGEFKPGLSPYLSPICLLLSLVFVLFVPGYLLQCILFPLEEDLDGIERVGLSLTLSVVLVSIMGLVLNGLPWGFSRWSIFFGQTALVLLLMVIVIVLRFTFPVDQVYAPRVTFLSQVWWSSMNKTERRLITPMVGLLLMVGLGTAWVIAAPSDSDFMTEFYILGEGGMAEDYPRSAVANEPVSVTAGVANLEREPANYWVMIKSGDRSIYVSEPFTLGEGETWRGQLSFAIPEVGDNQKIDILLGRQDHEFPYRSLSLWLDVKFNP